MRLRPLAPSFGRPVPAATSENVEIYELSEIISEILGNSARCDHALYLLCHGGPLYLADGAEKGFSSVR
jgi:hypothetical protein